MTNPRIYAVIPGKDESGRYLEACLTWLTPMVEGVAFYDDRSDDDTAEVAKSLGCEVAVRPADLRSFTQHEGSFRAQLWRHFEDSFQPDSNTWVLAIDCDEFLVDIEGRHSVGPGGTLGTLRGVVSKAHNGGFVGVVLPIPEVFGWSGACPLVRKDGFWGSIRGPRLFRYPENGLFRDKAMGCGSEPSCIADGPLSQSSYGLNLMHFGYADPTDRNDKYDRYSSLPDHGHDGGHVQSIVQNPVLELWAGPVPNVWRGHK